MDGESDELTEWGDVAGAWAGKSETEGLEWGWRRDLGSWFQRHGEAYLRERSVSAYAHGYKMSFYLITMVMRNEDDVGGRARVTRDEERVLRGGW